MTGSDYKLFNIDKTAMRLMQLARIQVSITTLPAYNKLLVRIYLCLLTAVGRKWNQKQIDVR